MQKLSNFTGQARHGWEKMTPAAFGMGRPNTENVPAPQPIKRTMAAAPMSPLTAAETMVNLSFNVPFSSNLTGPDPEEILHASPGAYQRWTHPEGTEEGTPTHKLPVHTRNVDLLRKLCKHLSEVSGGRLEATVTSSEPKPVPAVQRRPLKGLVTNVCVTGDTDIVHKMRAKILNETPIALVKESFQVFTRYVLKAAQKCAMVDVDTHLIVDASLNGVKLAVLEHMDKIAVYTGSDMFLLNSKPTDPDNSSINYANGSDQSLDQRLRIAIYADPESCEHAKTRLLIMIDQIVSVIRMPTTITGN